MSKGSVFDRTYKDYITQVFNVDLESRAEKLGVRIDGDELLISFFGKPYRVSPKGIADPSGKRPAHSISVVLCKYLLLCPEFPPREHDWVSYKDFKDAAPFVGAFANNVERTIAKNFRRRLEDLRLAGEKLTGRPPETDFPYQLSVRFEPLPKVPLLMLFNDEDEEFSARCLVLFERRAEKYLDMECLAIVGWLLSDYLERAAGGKF
jgi:hypothetical protein